MSTKHVRTTGDLVRFGAALRIDCRACGATRTLVARDAVAAFGLAPLHQVQTRSKCSRCKKKEATVIVLSPV
jgi:hypothetical protein